MSKTIETQIEKSNVLIKGFRNNIEFLRDKGINKEILDDMENNLRSLEELNRQCDEMRAKLKDKVKEVNDVLSTSKQAYFDMKKIIKCNYLQEEWSKFGVMDKR